MTTPQGMLAYVDLPKSAQEHLLALEEFIGDCDGKDTVISNGDTCIDDGTIDASDAVRAFNGIVALLRQAAAPNQGREALEAARKYVEMDARNKKYPLAIETLAKIDAALAAAAVGALLTDEMVLAGARVGNPIAFEKKDDGEYLLPDSARESTINEVREILTAALALIPAVAPDGGAGEAITDTMIKACARAMAENAGFAWEACAQSQWRGDARAGLKAALSHNGTRQER